MNRYGMVFEKFIRYAGLAVGLKPSARGCEGRLRGLYRMMYSTSATECEARRRGRERMMYSKTMFPIPSLPGPKRLFPRTSQVCQI